MSGFYVALPPKTKNAPQGMIPAKRGLPDAGRYLLASTIF